MDLGWKVLVFAGWLVAGPAAASDVSAKVYVEYKKATIGLTPTKDAIAAAKAQGLDSPKMVTYHPNVVPALGGGLDLYGLGGSYSVSVPQSAAEKAARGETKYSHSDVHVSRWRWLAFDARREQYKGFFRREDALNSFDAFGDSLFKSHEEFDKAPDMELTWTGGSALFSLNPGSLALNEAVSTTAHPHRSGWAPLVMVTANKIEVHSPTPLVPDDQASYFGDDAGLVGGTFFDAGLLPGLGFTLASETVFGTVIAACGVSWQSQAFDGIDRQKAKMRGSACDLRGSAGLSSKWVAFGLVGYKTVQTITAETVNVSPASSSVQIYLSIRL